MYSFFLNFIIFEGTKSVSNNNQGRTKKVLGGSGREAYLIKSTDLIRNLEAKYALASAQVSLLRAYVLQMLKILSITVNFCVVDPASGRKTKRLVTIYKFYETGKYSTGGKMESQSEKLPLCVLQFTEIVYYHPILWG